MSTMGDQAIAAAKLAAKKSRMQKAKELTSRGYPELARDVSAKSEDQAKSYIVNQAIKTKEKIGAGGRRIKSGG